MSSTTESSSAPQTPDRFSGISIAFHWVVGLMILAVIALSYYMESLPASSYKYQVYNLHKSIGILVLIFAVPRLIWRFTNGRPPKLPHYQKWEVLLSSGVTWLMYGLMLTMPLSGWLMNSAGGYPLKLFGAIEIPALLSKNKELGEVFEEGHEIMGLALQILIGLHVAGTLKHFAIDKDSTLYRMLPLKFLNLGTPK